jgi:hypothetical protein
MDRLFHQGSCKDPLLFSKLGLMNTLVAVCIGLVAFAEWKDVHISKLIVGSVLVVIGGTLVANS